MWYTIQKQEKIMARIFRTLCTQCHLVKASGADGLCDECRSKYKRWTIYQKFKGSSIARYGRKWYKLRQSILKRDSYLCQECLRNGKYQVAEDVDHIVPLTQGGTDDESNLQSLCHECHKIKTARESQTRYK